MAKQSGLGDNFYYAGVDLSGDVGQIGNVSGGPAAMDVTGIDKSGFERIGGRRDGHMEWSSWFNPARAHLSYSDLPTSDVLMTYCRGTTLGNPGAAMIGKVLDYPGKMGNDGSFTFELKADASAGYPLEWGRQGTAGIRTDGSATNGSSIDDSASSSFGLSAYLHVFAFTGTSVTVKIQESSDDGGSDAFADVTGGAFTAATGVTSQRIETASDLSVERYLRVVTTGTFSDAQFAVLICRRLTAVT